MKRPKERREKRTRRKTKKEGQEVKKRTLCCPIERMIDRRVILHVRRFFLSFLPETSFFFFLLVFFLFFLYKINLANPSEAKEGETRERRRQEDLSDNEKKETSFLPP